MKTKKYTIRLRNIIAACLAMMIFTTSSMIALAGTENKSLMGEITVSGNGGTPFVVLNGENAFTGRTFFSNGTIATPENTTSTVKLGKLGYITMSPNTTLSLSFDEKTISGTLSAGDIKVFNADGVDVKIQNFNNALAVPMNKGQDDDDDKGILGGSAVGPVIVFGGIVAAAVILVLVHNRDNDGVTVVSPIR